MVVPLKESAEGEECETEDDTGHRRAQKPQQQLMGFVVYLLEQSLPFKEREPPALSKARQGQFAQVAEQLLAKNEHRFAATTSSRRRR
jgi:hypothetical protein